MRSSTKMSLLVGIIFIVMGVMVALASAQEPTDGEATPESTAAAESTAAPELTSTPDAEATPELISTPEPASDAYCLLCHTQPDLVWELPSGEALSVTIDPSVLANSVHGESSAEGALACADCHPDFRYPHPVSLSQTVREFQIERYAICRNCHEDQYTRAQDSVHGEFLRQGRLEAATCIDCHGGHDIQTPNEPRQRISLTCGRCHGAIFEEFRGSVHGAALLDENNPDVPTCIDCHGVHNIQNPMTTLFRTSSPELCATCHADSELMSTYDISTQVFDSYVADFHGTTVELFEHETPGVVTNQAVCFDCHGVHNIQAVDGEGVSTIRENLLTTCRQCHPSASADFSAAWIGHYPATPETHPLFYYLNALYDILIPGALVLFGVVIVSDLFRRLRRRS
jgi:predicted CXXCH cytochrome family protein